MDAAPPIGVSERLCAFLVEARERALPEEVRAAARTSILNVIATGIAGCTDPAVAISLQTMAPFSGTPTAHLIGRPEKVDPMLAAFLNAAASNVHDFDDTHLRTIIHPAGIVVTAVLAFAETRKVSGEDALTAIALGMETTCRIGNAVSPGHYGRGWHITATCGVFGAAVAIGTLLKLDEGKMCAALGIASAQSCGLVETLGFMAKSIGVGSAARGGLTAALLAEAGLDGPKKPLEGPRGFLQVTADAPVFGEITDGLGERWEVLGNYHKPYPCGIVLNAVIDATLELITRRGEASREATKITIFGHPLLLQRADRPSVATGREAQVSAQHAVATVLVSGAGGLDAFSDAAVADPAVLALRPRVTLVEEAREGIDGVRLVAVFPDGSEETVVIEHALGTTHRPMSHGEVEDKLRAIAARAGRYPVEELIAALNAIADSPDIANILPLTLPLEGTHA